MNSSTIGVKKLPRSLRITPDCDCEACMIDMNSTAIRLCEAQVRRLLGMLSTVVNDWTDEDAE